MVALKEVNFVSPGSLIALAISFSIISTVLVCLRLYGRRLQKQKYGIDDFSILFAWLSLLAMAVNMIVAVANRAWGSPGNLLVMYRGEPAVNPLFLQAEKFVFIQDVIFPAQLAFTKLSILFFYRRVLCPEKRGYLHWSTLGLIAIIAMWGMAMFFVYLFQCGPVPSDFWADPFTVETNCLPIAIEWFTTISDFVLDIIIFFLPVYRLGTLHMGVEKKIMVIGIFLLGAISVVASIVRGVIYLPLMKTLTSHPSKEIDAFMVMSSIVWWSMFEAGFGLVAACLPSLKLFVDKATVQFTSRYGSRNSSTRPYETSSPVSPRTPASVGRSSHSSQSSHDLEKGYVFTSVTSSGR